MACGCKGGDGVTNPAQTPVLVQYVGSCSENMEQVGQPGDLIGESTGHNYGFVQCGDIISVWLADVQADPESFIEVN